MLRITIFAALRVLPPLLITPAKASYPFMKETGPEAVAAAGEVFAARAERIAEKFVPVPDPHLKSIPSVLARSRIEVILSSTLLMKQAEHCGFSSTPNVEPDRAVEGRHLVEEEVLQLVVKGFGVLVRDEIAFPARPQAAAVLATRSRSCLTECSRSGLPRSRRKYFCATTFVASCDQNFGTSTLRCSKATSPALAGDAGRAGLPGQLLRRVHARGGEVPGDGDALACCLALLLPCAATLRGRACPHSNHVFDLRTGPLPACVGHEASSPKPRSLPQPP